MALARPRQSLGGAVVRNAIAHLGHTRIDRRISLVETVRPLGPLDTVLVQNAWNVVAQDELNRLLAPYSRGPRARIQARRALAAFNLRRARRVVCLSFSVASMIEHTIGVEPVVAPATVPIQDWQEPKVATIDESRTSALVIGAVTWYKRPVLALESIAADYPSIESVTYMGPDDGSGAWDAVKRRAHELGLNVQRSSVPHRQVYQAMAEAQVVVVASELESLSFGLSEALLHAPNVLASPLPVHREVANRVGRAPHWIGLQSSTQHSMRVAFRDERSRIDLGMATDEWEQVARALGLC